MGKNLALISFKYGVSSSFSLQFPLRYFYNHYLLPVNVYLMQNMEKKPHWNTSFFVFFTTVDLTWPKFCRKNHTHFTFFWLISRNMLGDTININNYLCCNLAVLKKLVKPLKNCFLDRIYKEKGSLWAMLKMGKKFFGRNNKSRSSAFRKFLFYQNIICFDWVMDIFLSWVMFSVKKVSFPAKTAVGLD